MSFPSRCLGFPWLSTRHGPPGALTPAVGRREPTYGVGREATVQCSIASKVHQRCSQGFSRPHPGRQGNTPLRLTSWPELVQMGEPVPTPATLPHSPWWRRTASRPPGGRHAGTPTGKARNRRRLRSGPGGAPSRGPSVPVRRLGEQQAGCGRLRLGKARVPGSSASVRSRYRCRGGGLPCGRRAPLDGHEVPLAYEEEGPERTEPDDCGTDDHDLVHG